MENMTFDPQSRRGIAFLDIFKVYWCHRHLIELPFKIATDFLGRVTRTSVLFQDKEKCSLSVYKQSSTNMLYAPVNYFLVIMKSFKI